jgi:hypothetical protein
MEEEIMGMEGLSEDERNALIEEQRQIMAQIEQEKQANAQAIANAQADAFDQCSANAVAQVASDSGPTRAVVPPSDSAETRTVDLGEDSMMLFTDRNELVQPLPTELSFLFSVSTVKTGCR